MIEPEGERPTTPVVWGGRGSTPEDREQVLSKFGVDTHMAPLNGRDSLSLHVQVTDAALIYKDFTNTQIGELLGLDRRIVSRILDSKFAKQRLDLTVDIKPDMQRRLRNNAFKALDYQGRALTRATEQMADGVTEPIVAFVHAGDRAASETLKGTGIFQNFVHLPDTGEARGDFVDIQAMLADPALRKALEAKKAANLRKILPKQAVEEENV